MIFKVKFLSKIAKQKKRTCGADVASGPRRADVVHGTTAPLRRGTEATWQDACGPRDETKPRGRRFHTVSCQK